MGKEEKEIEQRQRAKDEAEFNSESISTRAINQNQGHNARKESLGPNGKR